MTCEKERKTGRIQRGEKRESEGNPGLLLFEGGFSCWALLGRGGAGELEGAAVGTVSDALCSGAGSLSAASRYLVLLCFHLMTPVGSLLSISSESQGFQKQSPCLSLKLVSRGVLKASRLLG